MTLLKHIRAGVLEVAYHEAGPASGTPVFLMHGFPYDIHTYAEVAPLLAAQGCRVIVPYLRAARSGRIPDDRALSARLWRYPIPEPGHTALG